MDYDRLKRIIKGVEEKEHELVEEAEEWEQDVIEELEQVEHDWYEKYLEEREKKRRIITIGITTAVVVILFAGSYLLFFQDPGFSPDVNSSLPGNNTEKYVDIPVDNDTIMTFSKETVDYRDLSFVGALNKSLKEPGKYQLRTNLDYNECYRLGIDWDSKDNYVTVEKLISEDGNCLSGDSVKEENLTTRALVNFKGESQCICKMRNVDISVGYVRSDQEINSIIVDVKSIE